MKNNTGEILFYKSEDGDIKINVIFENETIWLSQKQMGELFGCTKENIILHLKNIFYEGEVEQNSVTKDFLVTASDGKKYNTKHYNLDAIIAVGYRVNSYKATKFRIWSNKILQEYIIKGFTMDDERLKNGKLMKMQDWIKKTKSFIEMNDMELLIGKGNISKKEADEKANTEFQKFRIEQDKNYIGDFDKFIEEVKFKKLK